MYTTSVTLLERLRGPEAQAAWARFVEIYTPLFYRWGQRLGLQDQDAADLVQEVFVTLVQQLPEFRYDPQKSFRRWLRTLLLNKWRDRWRHRAARPVSCPGEDLDQVAAPDVPDPFEEEEYRHCLVNRVLKLIQVEFQPVTWKAFCEHMVQGHPPAAVAAELGVSVNAVYLAKSRVLRRLREELDGLLD
jgi:RNA polymerase sigma-70 factor (ECF subfamily)